MTTPPTKTVFFDRAHQPIHELAATNFAGPDRTAAAHLLESTQRVEADLGDRGVTDRLAEDLTAVADAVLAIPTPSGQPTPPRAEEAPDDPTPEQPHPAPDPSTDRSGRLGCGHLRRRVPVGGDGDASPVAPSVASYDLVAGRTGRFLLGLFSADKSQLVAYGQVNLRFSYLGPTGHPLPKPLPGPSATAGYDPIPGQHLNLADPGPRLVDPSDARGVYRATGITFDRPGIWQVAATVTLKPGGTTTVTSPFEVLASSKIPNVGDQAPATVNPIPGDGTPAKAIDSRASDSTPIPDPELHRTTVAAALAAHQPTVVVVSTPTYCVSRFCGPVTDSASTLAKTFGDKAAFIHLEVWEDFDKSQLNPAAAEWIRPTGAEDAFEPWTFVIDRTGRITHRFDNVAGEDELQAAVDQVTR